MALYFEASRVIKDVISKKASLKTLVFSSDSKNKKQLYALACETLKYKEVLEKILDKCDLLRQVKTLKGDRWLALVLLYDHLLGKRLHGKFKDVFVKQRSSIHAQGELLKVKAGVTDLKHLVADISVQVPKYVRVNTLCRTQQKVIEIFQAVAWVLVPCDKENFYEVESQLKGRNFTVDPHIPNLLVFPPCTDFSDNGLYTTGHIIIQDKASCVPAYILSPPEGAMVIDCCAAPGNKTSHLAALMNNKGTVYAFDKSIKRLETMKKLMKAAKASCVKPACADFLTISPSDPKYRDVEYILVDPSCSGSGMINRVYQHTDETDEKSSERLKQLAQFQVSILQHALSFPRVKRVTYSTCSIHEEENEQVVESVMLAFGDTFMCCNIMPDWPFRGVEGYEHAQCCVRMSHDQALTNGFFVACFERREAVQTVCEVFEPSKQTMSSDLVKGDVLESNRSTLRSDVNERTNSAKRKSDMTENKSKKKKRRKKKKKSSKD